MGPLVSNMEGSVIIIIIIITGPNENSQKASKSVNVLAANSQVIIMIRTGLYAESGQTLEGSFSA